MSRMTLSMILLPLAAALALLGGCAGSPPTAAERMLAHAVALEERAAEKSALAAEWERGEALVAAGEKQIKAGEKQQKKAVRQRKKAEKQLADADKLMQDGSKAIQDGQQKIAEGQRVMQQSEQLFQERFPDALLAD